MNVLNDMAAPLGGEVTMAFDGPMIPTPRWKLIFEVYDPDDAAIDDRQADRHFNREGNAKGHSAAIDHAASDSRTYFVISSPNQVTTRSTIRSSTTIWWPLPIWRTISRAIQTREAGSTLPHSSGFQALLPTDGYTNFSAIYYHNIGPVVGPLAAS